VDGVQKECYNKNRCSMGGFSLKHKLSDLRLMEYNLSKERKGVVK